jgi:SAM-dependent methyltransferase
MSKGGPSNNPAYTLAMSDTEINRLLGLSRFLNEHAKDGFRRAGLKSGNAAIDVGCGALGVLVTLAEAVGPTGRVVGLDLSAESLGKARQIVDRQGIANVEFVQADINELTPQSLTSGSFDVAFCRLFLMHQPDPKRTLRQIATLIRPGGHIVAHELLYGPYLPKSDPEIPEFDTMLGWLYEVMTRAGASPDVPHQFHDLCCELGLREVSIRGYIPTDMSDTAALVRQNHDLLVAIRPRIVQFGIASEAEISRVLAGMVQASEKSFRSLFPGIMVEVVAQVPDPGASPGPKARLNP